MNKGIRGFITCARNLGRYIHALRPILANSGKREPGTFVKGGFFLNPCGEKLVFTTPVSCHFHNIEDGDIEHLDKEGIFWRKVTKKEWETILEISEFDAGIQIAASQSRLLIALMAEVEFQWGYITTDNGLIVYWPIQNEDTPSSYFNFPLILGESLEVTGKHLVRSKLLLPLMRYVEPRTIAFTTIQGTLGIKLTSSDGSKSAIVSELDMRLITVEGNLKCAKEMTPELLIFIQQLVDMEVPKLSNNILTSITDRIQGKLFR